MKDVEIDFEWDPLKAASNYAKHRVDFETATDVFYDPFATSEDDIMSIGEFRASTVGMSRQGILIVVYTERYENLIRIISARKANRHEQRRYIRPIP